MTNKIYCFFYAILFVITITKGHCQHNDELVNIDSLSHKNFAELKQIFYKNIRHTNIAREIAKHTLNKALISKNGKETANSYARLYATYFNDIKKGKKFLDSCIAIGKRNDYKDILAKSFFHRGNLYYNAGRDEEALSDYLEAELNTITKNELYYKIILNIGILKTDIGKNHEALKIFKECLKYNMSEHLWETNKYEFSEMLYALSTAYINIKLHDSATKYSKWGYKYSKKSLNSSHLRFTYIEGINNFFLKKYKASKDSILKSIPYLEKKKDLSNLAIAYFYLGKIYQAKKDNLKMIFYLKKVDSIFDKTGYTYPNTRESYELLIKEFEKRKDITGQLNYVKKLLKVDSILNARYRFISNSLHREFDTKNLSNERDFLESKLKKTETESRKYIYFFSIIILLALIILIYNYKKKKLYKKKFLTLLKSIDKPKEKPKNIEPIGANFIIDTEVVDSILSRLDYFETKRGFLSKGITLNIVAKQSKTNSKYLSKIINQYKGNSFRNYINKLRIEYIVKELKSNNNIRKYTIKAIAEEAGFSNPESYSKAFFKFTGIHTSYFIKNLNDINSKINKN